MCVVETDGWAWSRVNVCNFRIFGVREKRKKETSSLFAHNSFLFLAFCFLLFVCVIKCINYALTSSVAGISVKILNNTVRISLIGFYWQHTVSPLTFTVWNFRLANISSSVLYRALFSPRHVTFADIFRLFSTMYTYHRWCFFYLYI